MTSQPPIYEHSDIPPGMTCGEYRRRKLGQGRTGGSVSRFALRGRTRAGRARARHVGA